jgi:hypothetical protein
MSIASRDMNAHKFLIGRDRELPRDQTTQRIRILLINLIYFRTNNRHSFIKTPNDAVTTKRLILCLRKFKDRECR